MIAQVNKSEERFKVVILANDESDPAQETAQPREYIMEVKFSRIEREMMTISIYPEASIDENPEQKLTHTIQWRNKKS